MIRRPRTSADVHVEAYARHLERERWGLLASSTVANPFFRGWCKCPWAGRRRAGCAELASYGLNLWCLGAAVWRTAYGYCPL